MLTTIKSDVYQQAARRHAHFYAAQLREAETLYKNGGDHSHAALRHYDNIATQVEQAFLWAKDHRLDPIIFALCAELVISGDSLLNLRQPRPQRLLWLETAIHSAQDHTATLLRLLPQTVQLYADMGAVEKAISLGQRLEGLAGGDLHALARTLNSIGFACIRKSDYETASHYLHRALTLMEQLEDHSLGAAILNNLGTLALTQGNLTPAQTYFERSLALHRSRQNLPGMAGSLNNLGSIASRQNRLDEAQRIFSESLALRRQLGDQNGTALTLTNLGMLAMSQGKDADAVNCWSESLEIARQNNLRYLIGLNLSILGAANRQQGALTAAENYLHEGIAVLQSINQRRSLTDALVNLAMLYLRRSELAAAQPVLQECLQTAREINVASLMLYGLLGYAWWYAKQDNPGLSTDLFRYVDAHPLEKDTFFQRDVTLVAHELPINRADMAWQPPAHWSDLHAVVDFILRP